MIGPNERCTVTQVLLEPKSTTLNSLLFLVYTHTCSKRVDWIGLDWNITLISGAITADFIDVCLESTRLFANADSKQTEDIIQQTHTTKH